MKSEILFGLLLLFVVAYTGYRIPHKHAYSKLTPKNMNVLPQCSIISTTLTDNLDNDAVEETITFLSPSTSVWGGATHVSINTKDQGISVNGYYRTSNVISIKRDLKILAIELITGKSINTLLYTYKDEQLVRIPVSTEHLPSFAGIVTRNAPEFIDTDNDGTLEMLAYQRYFPPEAKRLVEVYKFDNDMFNKQLEYEEITQDIYL